ncbi:MAG: hypothetical protein ACD_79C00346G0002 [uncultured bacterium]|nr:MAG: hypothetical protein ACD_79C00346G0002 [uncultured bacterium]
MAQTRTRKKIVIKGNDYDGCLGWLAILLNTDFIKTYELHKELVNEIGQYPANAKISALFLEKFLEKSDYGKKIATQAKHLGIEKIILISSSNRQDIKTDVFNRIHNRESHGGHDNGSAFLFLSTFASFLKKRLGDKIEKDQRTLSDIWKGKNFGCEYEQVKEFCECYDIKKFNQDDKNLNNFLEDFKKIDEEKNKDSFFNHSKIPLLYAQMHSFAKEHKDNDILFEFYDDRKDICLALYYAFSKFPELLPENVDFKIYRYSPAPNINGNEKIIKGSVLKNAYGTPLSEDGYHIIKGDGKIDKNYQENVKKLHAIYQDFSLLTGTDIGKDILELETIGFVLRKFKKEHRKDLQESALIANSLLSNSPSNKLPHESSEQDKSYTNKMEAL